MTESSKLGVDPFGIVPFSKRKGRTETQGESVHAAYEASSDKLLGYEHRDSTASDVGGNWHPDGPLWDRTERNSASSMNPAGAG